MLNVIFYEKEKSAMSENPIFERIKGEVDENEVVLFMKGTPVFHSADFHQSVFKFLSNLGIQFKGVNVLEDEEVREGIKAYSNWPTIPQLYVKGEFVGGCDIVREMYESGELMSFLIQMGLIFSLLTPNN